MKSLGDIKTVLTN